MAPTTTTRSTYRRAQGRALRALGNIDVVADDAGHVGSAEVAGLWRGKAGAMAFSEDSAVGSREVEREPVDVGERELAIGISARAPRRPTHFPRWPWTRASIPGCPESHKWPSALVRGLSERPFQVHEVCDVNTNHFRALS